MDVTEFFQRVFEFGRDEEGGERDVLVREFDEREVEVEPVVQLLSGRNRSPRAVWTVGQFDEVESEERGGNLQPEPVCDSFDVAGCELPVEVDPVVAQVLVRLSRVESLQVDEVRQFDGRVVRPVLPDDGQRSRSAGQLELGRGYAEQRHGLGGASESEAEEGARQNSDGESARNDEFSRSLCDALWTLSRLDPVWRRTTREPSRRRCSLVNRVSPSAVLGCSPT